MELEDYRKYIIENIRSSAEISQDFFRTAFIEEMTLKLIEAEELCEFQLCQYEGSGARNRKLQLDGYTFDDVDGSVSLVLVDFTNDDEMQSFGASDTKASFNSLKNLIEEIFAGKITDGSIEESHPVYGLAAELELSKASITKFKLFLITDKILKTKTKKWEMDAVSGFECELHIWDMARFHQVHQSTSGRDDLKIDFNDFGVSGLPCIKAGSSKGEYEAYLCMIPGEVLASIYNHFGSRLLEGNVRSFLSVKVKVNKGIQNTINESPEMFFAYNNGIAATAEGIDLIQNETTVYIKTLSNLQIVNGGQTTASLGAAKRRGIDISKVFVQMKLSVLPAEKAEALIPLISRYANLQNKVSDADFFSNHPYHVRLEEISRRIFTPPARTMQHGTHWFYERARGQYLNEQTRLTPAQKAKFLTLNPKNQLLTKTDVAKVLNTFRGIPQIVSLGGQKNFVNFAQYITDIWEKSDEAFDDEYFKQVIARVIIFKSTEDIVSDQDWYQKSYRANIVTYTLSKLQSLIESQGKGKELNLKAIWDKQELSSALVEQIEVISEVVFRILTDPNRAKENVTEWAKVQGCLNRVLSIHITLSTDFLKELVDKTIIKKIKPKRKVEFDDTLLEDSPGLLRSQEYKKLLTFGLLHNVLNANEVELLRSALLISHIDGQNINENKLSEIKKRLLKIGYAE